MRKCASIFLFFFFILPACRVLAGSTSLTTYYPAPTATYNKVQLSTPSCASNNTCPVGTIYTDSSGALHAIMKMNGTNVDIATSTQSCYNTFCTYSPLNDPTDATCANYTSGTGSVCKTGFSQQSVDQEGDTYDSFNTSADSTVISIACCSNLNSTNNNSQSPAPAVCPKATPCGTPGTGCTAFPAGYCDCARTIVADSCGICNGTTNCSSSCTHCSIVGSTEECIATACEYGSCIPATGECPAPPQYGVYGGY